MRTGSATSAAGSSYALGDSILDHDGNLEAAMQICRNGGVCGKADAKAAAGRCCTPRLLRRCRASSPGMPALRRRQRRLRAHSRPLPRPGTAALSRSPAAPLRVWRHGLAHPCARSGPGHAPAGGVGGRTGLHGAACAAAGVGTDPRNAPRRGTALRPAASAALINKNRLAYPYMPPAYGDCMAKAKSTYEEDYGEYVPGEDDIAYTYKSIDAAEEAVLRRVLGE